MKKVFLKIYPELNLGDDLFLKIILERYKDVSFYFLGDSHLYEDFLKVYPNLNIIDKLSYVNKLDRLILRIAKFFSGSIYQFFLKKFYSKQHLPIISEADLFVTIGGSMFIQNEKSKIQHNLIYYDWIGEKFTNKPKFYLGCNFGPFVSEDFRLNFERYFLKAEDVSFREINSRMFFPLLENIRVNPDIVFGLPIDRKVEKIKNSVGLVLIDPRVKIKEDFDYSTYLDQILIFLRLLISEKRSVHLFSFCKKENDESVINDVLALLKVSEKHIVHHSFYNGNLKSFLAEYSKVETMICGRFHSLILSMLYNQNILPVIYSDKMINVLQGIHFEGHLLDLRSSMVLDVDFDKILASKYNVESEIKNSFNNFLILDKVLNKF